nr:metal ABC transporter substrate-binding protein [Neobacillus sp. Marseille-Q6967]
MKILKTIVPATLVLGLFLTGCGTKETATSEKTTEKDVLTVSTTIYPLQDFTEKIGGNFVEVQSIYPPGVDAHSFEPTTKDMITLAESDLFIYTGVGIEGFVDKAINTLEQEKVTILQAADGIELAESSHSEGHDHEDENGEHTETEHETEEHAHEEENHETEEHANEEDTHDHGDVDPHVWLDPVLAINLAENIKESLSTLMPAHKEEFEANYMELKTELEKLDQEFKTVVENSRTKHLLVSHDAYGYWEKRYGIETIAINGLSPTQEPSQKELQEIIKESSEHGIEYVIFEPNVSPKVAEIIQKEIGAKPLTLHNLEALTDEDLKQNDDYFSIMRQNIESIKTALN